MMWVSTRLTTVVGTQMTTARMRGLIRKSVKICDFLRKCSLQSLPAVCLAHPGRWWNWSYFAISANGRRVRFEIPSGHLIELYAEKEAAPYPGQLRNPQPWA
jgi:hypothetical protein